MLRLQTRSMSAVSRDWFAARAPTTDVLYQRVLRGLRRRRRGEVAEQSHSDVAGVEPGDVSGIVHARRPAQPTAEHGNRVGTGGTALVDRAVTIDQQVVADVPELTGVIV
jgi:hypothetical protein